MKLNVDINAVGLTYGKLVGVTDWVEVVLPAEVCLKITK